MKVSYTKDKSLRICYDGRSYKVHSEKERYYIVVKKNIKYVTKPVKTFLKRGGDPSATKMNALPREIKYDISTSLPIQNACALSEVNKEFHKILAPKIKEIIDKIQELQKEERLLHLEAFPSRQPRNDAEWEEASKRQAEYNEVLDKLDNLKTQPLCNL